MEPILNLIKTKVCQGILRYELDQRLEELRALQPGVTQSERSNAVVDYSANLGEDEFERQWSCLAMGSALWGHLIPVTSRTREFRRCLFRMLSCSRCLVSVKLRMLHLQLLSRGHCALWWPECGSSRRAAEVLSADLCYRDRECVQAKRKSQLSGKATPSP